MLRTPGRAVLIALSASGISAAVWIFFLASWHRPIERRISNVALSRTGKWTAAGTSQGLITIWNQEHGTRPRQVNFPKGPLNDLQLYLFTGLDRRINVAGHR